MSTELGRSKRPETLQRPETTRATKTRLQQFLRDLYDSVARGRAIAYFKEALARVAGVEAKMRGETNNDRPKNKPERRPSDTFGNDPGNPDRVKDKFGQMCHRTMSRRGFLKAAIALGAVAVLPNELLNPKPSYAAELNNGTQLRGNNQETLTDPNEILRQIIEGAKEYIANEVPMLAEYGEILKFQERPNNNIGIQIPADIGNPPSQNNQVNRSGFELGAYTYSPYLDPNQPEKGRVYKRILEDLQKIKDTFSPEEQKSRLIEYLNALAKQILDRQKRYSAVMANFPGKPTRVGIGAEVVNYVNYIANQVGINDPETKAAILRTHPHVAQIIAMLQAGFDVDIQMNGLPPEFVEPDGDKPWPIYNPIKPEAIPALQEFIKILSLALPTESGLPNNQQAESANTQRIVRLSTANEPSNIHIGNQARIYARRLLEAQLALINNNSEITLIGPSIKTDYEGKLDTTFRIIDKFIEEIKAFVEEYNIQDPNVISKLLKCLPTFTVYAGNATAFMQKTNSLVKKIMEKLKSSGLLREGVQVEINFSEMGIEWPYFQGAQGLAKGAEQMVTIVQLLKKAIQEWVKKYPQLKLTGVVFIHNPGGPEYTGPSFDEAARQCKSDIPASKSPIPMLGTAPGTTPENNRQALNKLIKAIG